MIRLGRVVQYGLVGVVCLAILLTVLRVWYADLRVPLYYRGDAMTAMAAVQGTAENGWYLTQPRLGAPAEARMHAIPASETLHLIVLKGLRAACGDTALAVNLFYLLTFPLVAMIAYGVLRSFGLEPLSSAVAGILYAFLPGHFSRSTEHLFLSAYYLVPLAIRVVFWVYLEPMSLFRWRGDRTEGSGRFLTRRGLVSIAIMLLVASAGLYYAYFACFFLVMAGLLGCTLRRQARAPRAAGVLLGVTVLAGLANLAPSLLGSGLHGSPCRRSFIETELYGLKVVQLLLPNPDHPLHPLRKLRQHYDACHAPTESAWANLGIVGSIGFLALVAGLAVRRPWTSCPAVERGLIRFQCAGLLLAVVGGFGTVVAMLGLRSIRAYNRISFYLAFFALAMFMLLLERLFARIRQRPEGRRWWALALGAVLVFGIVDQSRFPHRSEYQRLAAEYHSDHEFIQRVEASLAPGAMVFQLPYHPFPESVPDGTMSDYDHLRAYLHSRTLRWSYGAMKEGPTDRWQAEAASKPVPDLVSALAKAGFAGIYVDRNGYADRAGVLQGELSHVLNTSPLRSLDDRLLFFPFGPAASERPPGGGAS